MKMYFEWAWMNHKDPWDYLLWSQKYLEVHVTLVLVHEWHKSNTKKTFEAQNIKSQRVKDEKEINP